MEIVIRIPKLTTMLRHWKWGLLVLLALALTLTSSHESAERAEAQIDITGKWNMTFAAGGQIPQFSCTYQVTQSGTSVTAVDPNCGFSPLTGSIDTGTGALTLFFNGPCGGFFLFQAFFTGGGTSMSGAWDLFDICNSITDSGTFSGAIKVTESQINITNLGQYALPKTCFDVRDDAQNPLFTVCDNDFQGPPAAHAICVPDGVCEDEDPAQGLIRVTVTAGDYRVVISKPPVNHITDPSKLVCDAVGGGKCELTFVNAPNTKPWFPWDVDGDGAVVAIDIGAVVAHFGEVKLP